jgi:hypothetical protein
MGFVEASKPVGPTERASAPGTLVLGRMRDTLRGRSPRSRLEELFAGQETALRLGQAGAPDALADATGGRNCARLSITGTMQVGTAWAVRAAQALHCDKR